MAEQSFSLALAGIRNGVPYRRRAWKNNKVLVLDVGDDLRMPHLTLIYTDGRRIPWVPVQCDMLMDDWEEAFG